jgi:hypothetical protein
MVLNENEIIDKLENHFKTLGLKVLSKSYTSSKGVDLLVLDVNKKTKIFIEV